MEAWLNWETVLVATVAYFAIRSLIALMRRRHERLTQQVREQLDQERRRRAKAKRGERKRNRNQAEAEAPSDRAA